MDHTDATPVAWAEDYSRGPQGPMKSPKAAGLLPTVTGAAITVLVAVSITDTVLSPLLVTHARAPPRDTTTPTGLSPTGTVAVTVLVAVSITDTVLSP